MTNKDIFLGALALVGEPVGLDAEDYAERAPYIIANFITENSALDDKYRAAIGAEPKAAVCPVFAADDDEFPLLPRFSPAAQYYLASMLIADEDGERSDGFFDKFCTAMTDIMADIPPVVGRIADVYGQ